MGVLRLSGINILSSFVFTLNTISGTSYQKFSVVIFLGSYDRIIGIFIADIDGYWNECIVAMDIGNLEYGDNEEEGESLGDNEKLDIFMW